MALVLTACGDGDTETVNKAPVEVNADPIVSTESSEIIQLQQRLGSNSFTVEDYKELARLYQEDNRIKEQRDVLEQAYRLYQEEEILELLQTIVVNVEEEAKEIQGEIKGLFQNISVEEYFDEGIYSVFFDSWFSSLMPKLNIGKRVYYYEQADNLIVVEVGYQNGKPYTNIWYTFGQDIVVILKTDSKF